MHAQTQHFNDLKNSTDMLFFKSLKCCVCASIVLHIGTALVLYGTGGQNETQP